MWNSTAFEYCQLNGMFNHQRIRWNKMVCVRATAILCVASISLFFILRQSEPTRNHHNTPTAACNLDYINNNHLLAQDDPCIIRIIRQNYLRPPSPRHLPYHMSKSVNNDDDPSQGNITLTVRRLNDNRTGGFFVECGGMDGEFFSNTLYLERVMNWTGILVEANPFNYAKLLTRNRKSWTLPVCLSLEPYPTKVSFALPDKIEDFNKNHLLDDEPCDWCKGTGHVDNPDRKLGLWEVFKPEETVDDRRITVQCFPLYSILVAVGRTEVDFFSLDIEGHELKVLKTIPWDRVQIKTLLAEWAYDPEGEQGFIDYLMNDDRSARYTANISLPNDLMFYYKKNDL